MSHELVVRGGRVINEGSEFVGDVAIDAGLVTSLTASGEAAPGDVEMDASGCYVVPGGVDPHVHTGVLFGGFTSRDDFYSCSLAAAFGGTTTIVDFAIPYPREEFTPWSSFQARLAEIEGRAAIDVGLHSSIVRLDDGSLDEIPRLVDAGVTSFKQFTIYRGAVMLSMEDLHRALVALGAAGALAMVHAESAHLVDVYRDRFAAAGMTTAPYHALSRPPIAELDAVRSVIELFRATGTAGYFVHVSTPEAARAIGESRLEGVRVVGETCPQYLFLDERTYQRPDAPLFVCSPPIRGAARSEGMRDLVFNGELATWASDHSAYDTEQKRRFESDFTKMPNGLPGVETRCPLLFSEGVMSGRMSAGQFVRATAAEPARLTGLYPRKGVIAPGADADIAIYDPTVTVRLSTDVLHMDTDYTPFEGMTVRGWPTRVIARGRPIVLDGSFLGRAGDGRFLRRGAPVLS